LGFPNLLWSNVFGGGWLSVLTTLLDIAVISFILYKLIMLVKGTRAWQILWGLALFFLLIFVSDKLQLYTLNWLLRTVLPLGPVAIVILFYPELRHALEEMGRLGFWGRGFSFLGKEEMATMIDEVVKLAARLSRGKVGALIVIERETGLDNIVATGTRLDALVSQDLLHTVFFPGSPLHDGAAVIRSNRVLAVGCTLPLSDSPHISTMIHTRHKAAVGVTEQSDAVVVVVSEETGTISLAVEGRLERGLDPDALRERLQRLLIPQERSGGPGYRTLFRRPAGQPGKQSPSGAAPAPEPPAQETHTGSGSG
jgi:diadenylate cyclase